MTMDVLGRLKQVDELNWDQSVYATTTYSYNALNQITGSNQSGQTRSFDYDGHARLWKKTTPEQGLTEYNYNLDDTVNWVKDARQVITSFTYNNRHLVKKIEYNVTADPTGQTAATPTVSFEYDAAGNRKKMTDGLGVVDYGYDTMSRLTSETRTFTALVGSQNLPTGTAALNYTYNLGGELTGITGPSQFGSVSLGYEYDKIGRVTSVTGANYGGITNYVNSVSYRAFGMKTMTSVNNQRTLSLEYDSRMRVTKWDTPGVMGWDYAYATPLIAENTGRVAFASNIYDHTLDRSYDYDNVGRLWASHTGAEARGHAGYAAWGAPDGPYAENYNFDQLGNMTWRNGWGAPNAQYSYNPQHSGNKITVNAVTGAAVQHDAAGNLTNDGIQTYAYDASGQQTSASGTSLSQYYDGDTLRVKKIESSATTYYLRSSVLGGQVVAEIKGDGTWQRGFVYMGGQMVAVQQNSVTGITGPTTHWNFQDHVTKSQRLVDSAGGIPTRIDLDPWGGETGRSSNAAFQPHTFTTYGRDANGGDDAMMRRYQSSLSRFSQPDPYDGSYSLTNPQSLNRYAYVGNDPVNFVDPMGLDEVPVGPCPPGSPCSVDIFGPSEMLGAIFGGGRLIRNPISEFEPRFGGAGTHVPQNPTPTQQPNPNCITNAVSGSTGLARTFGNVFGNGSIAHDGVHALAPPGSTVRTLPALTGRVIDIHRGGDGTRIVDVLLGNGMVALYKDLASVSVSPGQRLNAGSVIGKIGGSGDSKNYGGLHFSLLKGGMAGHDYYRSLTRTGQTGKIMANMFVNPLGPNSPVNCPGVTANNAGVVPAP